MVLASTSDMVRAGGARPAQVMTLRSEDRALAAHLIRRGALPVETVLAAMEDAARTSRDLGDALVQLGAMDAPQVVSFRAEVAKRREGATASMPADQVPKYAPPPDEFGDRDDHDTWFDMPRPASKPGRTKSSGPVPPPPILEDLESASEGELQLEAVRAVMNEPDEPAISRGESPTGEWEGFVATRPYPPGRFSTPDVLGGPTLPVQLAAELAGEGRTASATPEDPWSDPEATRLPGDWAPPGALDDTTMREPAEVDVPLEPLSEDLRDIRRVDERYLMLGEIGRGGMGRILSARDREIGREVALKVLLRGNEASDSMIRRFWTEVQATGQLEHPSIIPIHDVGRMPSGEPFYVMKKLTGRTLAEIIGQLEMGDSQAVEEFTRPRLLTIFQQIANAVAFAHDHGVIHRDIKPANIMVGGYGEAILIDWGLAKVLGIEDVQPEADVQPVALSGRYSAVATQSGTITGTPQYMSPEATEGQPELLTPKSDVYGLGAVLYEILTLEPPYRDLGFVPTVMKVRKGELIPPRERAPHLSIPQELEELCLRTMAREPEARPRAKTVADEVGRILEGAKERERRKKEAKVRVRTGRASTERWQMLKLELQAAEAEAKRLAKEVPPWADVERKVEIWAIEDRVSELKIDAVSAFAEAEADFVRALGEVADDREARSALAALYFARFGEAERARDREGQRYYRSLVAQYDDGVWARVLEGDGALEVTTEPPGVSVTISRLQLHGRVLRPVEPRSLGSTPVQRFDLPIGSYLLCLSRDGQRDVLRPVHIGRTETVHAQVRWRDTAEIGEDFVLIPEGPAILGGDPIAHGGLERRTKDISEFCLARYPVTCDEYLAFLNARAREDLEAALKHVPRARAQEGYYWQWDEVSQTFKYPDKTPGGHAWIGSLPVNGVSMDDAVAYIAWRKALTGEQLRLPHEDEWEKAARSVDGRFFPWGDHFDPTFCKMKQSRDVPYPEPEPVGAFDTDTSPYGARDMAGGVREICRTVAEGEEVPVMRGGCWHDTGLFCRVAFRHVTQPDFVNTGLGFRLAKDLP